MNPAPTAPPTDVVAGRFALCDPIGAGGSGTVWRAWDFAQSRYCAGKLLRRRDAGQLLRFVREQAVRLEGEHVASPYAWAAEDADVLIATELVEGGSLHGMVGDVGPLAEPTVAVLLTQLLSALEQVHRVGLVHRDVKPGNVLLRATGTSGVHALLTDFGLAIGASDARLTELGTVIGTPGYLPPELTKGGAAPGPAPAQDLYAAGRTAQALLSGVDPKMGVPTEHRIADPALGAVVAALVDPDPDRRPGSAAEAAAMLAGARADPLPRTVAGAAVVIGSRLPPLPAGWHPRSGPDAGAGPVDRPGPVGPRPAMTIIDTAGPVSAVPAPPAGSPVRPPRRPSRWPLAVGGLGVLVGLAAIVVAVVLKANPPATGRSVPDPDGATTSASVPTDPEGPSEGSNCAWTAESHADVGPDGPVTCTLDADGRYRWHTAG